MSPGPPPGNEGDGPVFKTDLERCACAARLARERVDALPPEVVETCGRDRLLRDFERAFLESLPPVRRRVYDDLEAPPQDDR